LGSAFQLFREGDILNHYTRPVAQLDDELFYQKITNPETEKPFQSADLTPSYRRFTNGVEEKEALEVIRNRSIELKQSLITTG
jgi:hypothetical protein